MATMQDFINFCYRQAELCREREKVEKTVFKDNNIITQRERKIIEKPKYKHYLKVREVAKIASDNYGIKIGQNRLYEKLRQWQMIIPNSTEPYQRAVEEGYLTTVTKIVDTPYGDKIVMWTKVTSKGTAYILNRLRKEIYCG